MSIVSEELTEMASGEEGCRLYFDSKHVYRVFNSEQALFYAELFAKLLPEVQQKMVGSKLSPTKFSTIENEDQSVFIHDKIAFISYPHEWCASMLKDAALFHLSLQRSLLKQNLYLKDAHPWNILFDKGHFKFVDLLSIVEQDEFKYIVNTMFIPYFIKPLLGYAFGKREWVKKRLEATTLNAATDTMSYRDCLPAKKLSKRNILNVIELLRKGSAINVLNKANAPLAETIENLNRYVEKISVKIEDSPYKAYYSQKNELIEHVYSQNWCDKQKTVHQLLSDNHIETVLDVACNTGWYSILAAKLGKKVVALDVDEACVEELYGQVKQHSYDILPLWASFTDLTQDRFSIETGKRVLINFAQRVQCDAVLVLAVIHHLVLGQGMSFENVFQLLSRLTAKKLIIEFVSLEDDKIVDYPEFFSAYAKEKSQFGFYNLPEFLKAAKPYFQRHEIHPSHPKTRTMVVFEKI